MKRKSISARATTISSCFTMAPRPLYPLVGRGSTMSPSTFWHGRNSPASLPGSSRCGTPIRQPTTLKPKTYFSDPDGNGIELTFETPERGELLIVDNQPVARMADGKLQPGSAALDVSSLLDELPAEDDLSQPMPPGTRIGHVHLHVRHLDESIRFYQDIIGFGLHLNMSSFRMADFSLKTSFIPHALAINTWQGAGAPPPPADASGLRHWTLMVPDRDAVNEVASRITDADFVFTRNDNGIRVADPSRNVLHIASEK
jgi:catechol 2,3-dioxygenase